MKKGLICLFVAALSFGCTKTGDDMSEPNIYGTWNIGSINYSTEIDIGVSKIPVSGTSSEPSSMTFNKDMTCTYDVTMKTEPDTILGFPIAGIEVPLKDSGTFTFTESEGKVTSVVITNSMNETLDFIVTKDETNSQVWLTTATQDAPPLGMLDVDLTLNMTK